MGHFGAAHARGSPAVDRFGGYCRHAIPRFGLALLMAIVATQWTFEFLAGDSGWQMVAAVLVGGMAGGLTYTAVNDSPRALWRALRRGRS